MPAPEFLDELAHELKNQFPANSDQRIESEFFYESEWAKNHDYRQLASHVTTTNDDDVAVKAASLESEVSPLAREVRRKVNMIQRELGRIGPGWFHVGRKKDVPRGACYVGHHGHRYAWVGPEGRDALTEFTLRDGHLVADQGDPDADQSRLGEVLAG